MSNLRNICESIIAAGEKAKTQFDRSDYRDIAAHHADRLARALLVMEEKLKEIMGAAADCDVRCEYERDEALLALKETREDCHKTLCEIEEMLK